MKEIGRYTNIKRKVANRHLLKSRAFPRYITNAWPSEPGGPAGGDSPPPDFSGYINHTIYSRNNMGQKCEGNCGLWVPNEIILIKKYPEN